MLGVQQERGERRLPTFIADRAPSARALPRVLQEGLCFLPGLFLAQDNIHVLRGFLQMRWGKMSSHLLVAGRATSGLPWVCRVVLSWGIQTHINYSNTLTFARVSPHLWSSALPWTCKASFVQEECTSFIFSELVSFTEEWLPLKSLWCSLASKLKALWLHSF